MIYSDPSSPGADGDSHRLFLSIHLSIHLFISLSLPSVSIYPSIYVSLAPSSPFLPPRPDVLSRHRLPSLSVPCSYRVPTCEAASSRYSWGSIARGLVTRLRTHLLLARQLGPSVHQATILLISARIGSVAKCSQDYQFTMARGELSGAPLYIYRKQCRTSYDVPLRSYKIVNIFTQVVTKLDKKFKDFGK